MKNTVRFFEDNDSLNLYHLENSEAVLCSFDSDTTYKDINDIIELFNIKRIFDLNLRLPSWNDETYEKYCNIVKKFNKPIGEFASALSGKNIIELYNQAELGYKDDFWELVEYFNIYNRITSQEFVDIVEELPYVIRTILSCKKIVNKFDEEITKILMSEEKYAEIIIDDYAIEKKTNKRKMYMPNSLKAKEIQKILWQYIDWEKANPNYLKSITILKKCSNGIIVTDRIRYAAHKSYNDFWEKQRNKEQPKHFVDTEICFYDDSDVKKEEVEYDGEKLTLSYGTTWFKQNLDYPTLLNNFIHVFNFVDSQCRCDFLSKPSKLGTLENIFTMDGDKIYKTGIVYELKKFTSSAQLYSYIKYLKAKKINIENIFKWFFESYLVDEFSSNGFSYIEPSNESSCLEKILILIPQIDGIIKQFTCFLDDGYVDRDYFEFSSDRIRVTSAPSMLKNKYIYPKGQSINNAGHLIYSDQSMLNFYDKKGKQYKSFVELINHNNMGVDDFEDYNKSDIEFLIKEKYIDLDEYGYLRINVDKALTLRDLFSNGVISYKHYKLYAPSRVCILDEWLKEGKIIFEDTLFTRQEQKYIDYMLNVQRYNNGPELRNKYAHGTFALDENSHQKDYIELLKIMILIIIKINDEFCLKAENIL